MLTPGAINGRLEGGAGCVVVVVVVLVVGSVVVVDVSAPDAPADSTNADARPSAAQAASDAPPTANAVFLTLAV
jgi:hypothetical protein